MKKLMVLLLALAMLFTLSACKGSGNNGGNENDVSQNEVQQPEDSETNDTEDEAVKPEVPDEEDQDTADKEENETDDAKDEETTDGADENDAEEDKKEVRASHSDVTLKAAGKTVVYFGLILLLVMVFSGLQVSRAKLLDLMQSGRRNEELRLRPLWVSVVQFAAGVVCLLIAYAILLIFGMAYAIMSEAVLYAASPKWSDGTFSWEDAAKITGEAVDACMNEGGYVLYKTAPAADVAQNAYAYFHILLSDASRSTDKETIYGYGGRQSVWRDAGLPSNDRMSTAGPCPTQEQVDAYEFVAPDGESYPVLDLNTPYIGGDHTKPNYNQQALAAGYDPQAPYASLDPRFYASIYYNGAQRNLDGTGNRVETFVGGREGLTLNIDRTHTRTGYYMRKFNNWKSSHDNSADGAVRVFRLAELLLNHAEASNEAYGPDQNPDNRMTALEAINEVRSRAGMPLLDIASQDEFRLRCRNERRVELAFEEHRYWDVRRWGILGETDRTVTGMRITKEGNRFTYTRFKVGDRACGADKFNLYPLPQSEVNKANNNTGVQWQNPGWEQ